MQTLHDLTTDIIDSRDVIEAIDDLESIIDDEECTEEERKEATEALEEINTFFEEFMESSEWTYGLTMISEEYWIDYVQDLVTDCGYINKDIPSWIEIDWDTTAENIAQDYMFENDYYANYC